MIVDFELTINLTATNLAMFLVVVFIHIRVALLYAHKRKAKWSKLPIIELTTMRELTKKTMNLTHISNITPPLSITVTAVKKKLISTLL